MLYGARPLEWYEKELPHGSTPICDECKEQIQTDYRWNIEGHVYCDECAKWLFRESNDAEYGRFEGE